MHALDEDTITQAVIALNALTPDARLREVTTSLVQHLHAFARDVRLTEPEWRATLAFLDEAGASNDFAQLSDTLGLTALVMAQNHRRPAGCTEASTTAHRARAHDGAAGAVQLELRGRVLALSGDPVPGARVLLGRIDGAGGPAQTTAPDGRFTARLQLAAPAPVPPSSPAGRLLRQLGRPGLRPLHLPVQIEAPGYQPLVTQLFRRGDPDLEHDAAFGVRGSLLADWAHDPSRSPPAYTLAFDFVLHRTSAT